MVRPARPGLSSAAASARRRIRSRCSEPEFGCTAKQPIRLTRQELLDASGLTEAALSELERTQIVHTRRGTAHYGRDALTLAIAARRLAEYGIDGRHLRAFKLSADREVGLVEQAIAPYVRRAGSNRDVPGDVDAARDQLPRGAGADRHGARMFDWSCMPARGDLVAGSPAK